MKTLTATITYPDGHRLIGTLSATRPDKLFTPVWTGPASKLPKELTRSTTAEIFLLDCTSFAHDIHGTIETSSEGIYEQAPTDVCYL